MATGTRKPQASKPKQLVADRDRPPGMTSASTPLGIASLDSDAKLAARENCLAELVKVVRQIPAIAEHDFERAPRGYSVDLLIRHCSAADAGRHRLRGFGFLAEESGVQTDDGRHTFVWSDLVAELRKPEPAASGTVPVKVLKRGAQIEIAQIDRHPINRHPAESDVHARAESLLADGQLDDCEIRQLSTGRYQMISGETRLLAAAKIGWTQLRCTVIECDDAEAARRVALHNAQRKDLNPIEKAQLIERLCDDHGFTREQAAKDVGLSTGAAASNLVRLLKLPDVWQQRVAAGELPESFARLLVPVCHVPVVMDALDQSFTSEDPWEREHWATREALEEAIDDTVLRETRDLRGSESFIRGRWRKVAIDKKTLEANREALQIVTLPLPALARSEKREEVEVATNIDLYDQLWKAALAAAEKKGAEKETERSAAESSSRDLSPEEKAKRARQQREQLELRIKSWRHAWLASIVAPKLTREDIMRLLAWCILRVREYPVANYGDWERQLMEEIYAAGGKANYQEAAGHWRAIAEAGRAPNKKTLDEALGDFCSAILLQPDRDRKTPFIPYEVVIDLADRYGVDLDAEWLALQRPAPSPLLEQFFAIFSSDQLQDLAKELGVNLVGRKKRWAMAAAFVSPQKLLQLPKCLRLPEGQRKGGKKGR